MRSARIPLPTPVRGLSPSRGSAARRAAVAVAVLIAVLSGLLTASPAAVADATAPTPRAAAAAGTFRNPLNTGPDPFMTHWNGSYYLATTQGDSVRMWRSSSLGTLLAADPVTVWTDSDPSRNRNIWAPEFYRFGDRWYLYYTADDGVDDHHRLYVLESERDDPAGPYHFKAKLTPPNHANDFAIDSRHPAAQRPPLPGLQRYQPVSAQRAQHRPDVESLHRVGRRGRHRRGGRLPRGPGGAGVPPPQRPYVDDLLHL